MEYFNIFWDNKVQNQIEPIGLSKDLNKEIFDGISDIKKINEKITRFYLKDKPINLYVDYLDNSIPVVSERLKKMLAKFEPTIFFIPVAFIDSRSMRQELYWGMIPKSFDCISEKSEFNKNGTLKKLVVDSVKMEHSPRVLKVSGAMEDIIIVDLCVAEALLRRDFIGIDLLRVEKD